jgi:8-oxo-dGTP pyrophosphatase MutT (NUDIX family)
MTPVDPKPAASVLLVRPSAPGAAEPIEVYMIRRQKGMKFLGGFYAFPGGKIDPGDGDPATLARVRGVTVADAARCFTDGVAPIAYWVTVARELLEETGVLLACDAADRPVDARGDAIDGCRREVMDGASFVDALARRDWYADLRALRYLSHFTTPPRSPIRFTAHFFVCPLPVGQAPRLFTEETSEGFWILPGEGYRRFLAGEMAMAEPAEYALAYVAQFRSLDDLWAAHDDGRHKFHGIIHRIDVFWESFDSKANRFPR